MRALLCSSVLTGGFLLVSGLGMVPAYAGPCTATTVSNSANATTCTGGSSATFLDYPGSNPTPYTTGNFTLTLDSHDVNAGANGDGVSFSGVTNGNGIITLQNGSDVATTSGSGVSVGADGSVTTINVNSASTITGEILGINALSFGAGGNLTINTQAGTTVKGTDGSGIQAAALNAGNVVVDAQGVVTGTNEFSVGIVAQANVGTVKVTTGGSAITGGNRGIDATAAGAVTVITAAGKVEGTAGTGIFAKSTASTVSVTTGAGAVIGGGVGLTGIQAIGATGVTIDAGGDVKGSIGIAVNSGGAVKVTTAAGTTVTGTASNGLGISVEATAGSAEVVANGAVTGGGIGIAAFAVGAGGTVSVTTGTAAVKGNSADGIFARANSKVTIETNGDVTGTNGTGINAVGDGNANVEITTKGTNLNAVRGTNGAGINVLASGTGTVTITNKVTAAGSFAGIIANSGTGAIQITNDFVVQNTTGSDSSVAIRTTGGAATITNNNRIIGVVETDASADKLINSGGSVWLTEGASDFRDGSDSVSNSGRIMAGGDAGAADVTAFRNLEQLTNSGRIDLSDQAAGDGDTNFDRLETSGSYLGNAGGLELDAFLGGVGSQADVFVVGGDASGNTLLFVNDTNPGIGAFNPIGILVVDVGGTSAAETFALSGGPIQKGLFTYDLVFDPTNGEYRLVGLPGSDAFETLAAVASSQAIWRETTEAWSTRQENLRDLLAGSPAVTAVADPPVTGSTAPGGALWASVLGSWTERDDEASFANLDFDLSYSQNIYGVVGGADFRVDMDKDTSLLFGVMGGYVDSRLDFDDSSTSIDSNGAAVGAYAGVLTGGFFATVLVEANLLDMDFSSAGPDGEDETDVTTIGARGDFGYRFGDAIFVEPVVSLDAVSTKIDTFTIAGSDIDAGWNESYRAGAGMRLGYGGETVRASATARVWDEFATDNEVDILSGGPVLGISDDDLEGVYGDLSGQIDISLTANATLFVKGGVLFSDDVTKPNASGGFAVCW